MECIILAGGLGTRLRPLTYHVPKPILPLLNKPMIMHIIDKLPSEVDRVILAVNYKKEMLGDFFSTIEGTKEREIVLVEEKEPLGTGGAIKNCEAAITDSFIVFNGDVIHSLDPRKIIEFHKHKGGIGTLAVWEVEDPTRYGIIGYDTHHRVTRFLEKPLPNEVFSRFINAGTYVLEEEIFDHIETGRKVSIEREVYPFIADLGLYAFPFQGYWVDAGTREDFLKASSTIMDFRDIDILQEGENLIHPEAKIQSPVMMGKGCSISNAVVGPNVVLGDGVRLEKDVRIENSTLMNHSHVQKGSIIQNSIIGEGVTIEKRRVVEERILDSEEF